MASRITIELEAPTEITIGDALQQIAEDVQDDNESGNIRDGDRRLSWEIITDMAGIDIDRRQRLAAAALMMGFDLPQEMMAASRSMLAAARLCPGMTTGDLAPMGTQGRRHALEMARGLIDEMLGEAKDAPAPDDGVQVLRVFRLLVELDETLRQMAMRDNTTVEKLIVKALATMVAREGSQ